MYSAFSLRSPWAAAAETSSVIFGRSTSQRRLSSAWSARYPSGVMCCVPLGRGASSRASSSSWSLSLVKALFIGRTPYFDRASEFEQRPQVILSTPSDRDGSWRKVLVTDHTASQGRIAGRFRACGGDPDR